MFLHRLKRLTRRSTDADDQLNLELKEDPDRIRVYDDEIDPAWSDEAPETDDDELD